MKRMLDVMLAMCTLILALPLFAVIVPLIILFLGTPVLFQQQRPGLHGQPFNIFKFRTMTNALNSQGGLRTDAERLTRFGRWLRSTSLDELPELWNIIKGDMSFVGPRPLLMEYLPLYSAEQARRHEVRPGLTGWAQVNGRNALDWETRLAMDVWYVDNQSFWLDMKILFMTVAAVFRAKGISQPGRATMDKFRGSAR
jgi:lipopolysaccharide/colanic/teichoic acid biosynthesis glycosyltransferase